MMRRAFLAIVFLSFCAAAQAATILQVGKESETGYDEFMFLGWNNTCAVAVSYFSYPPLGQGLRGQPDYWVIGKHTIEPGDVDVITRWSDKGITSKAWDPNKAKAATEALLKEGFGPAGHAETIRDAETADRPGLAEIIASTDSFNLSYMTDWPKSAYKMSSVYYSPLSNCALVVLRDEDNHRESYRWKLIRLLNPGVRRTRARAHVTNGLLLYKEQMDIYAAEAELAIAAEMDPEYPLALYYHAQLLATHGRFDEALARLKAAVKLKPEYKKKAWKAEEFESLKRDLRFQAIVEKKPFFP